MEFAVPANHRVKMKENQIIDKYLELAREQKKTKKTMEHNIKGDGDINCDWCAWKDSHNLGKKRLEELKIKGRIETIQTTVLLRSVKILRRLNN